MPEVTCQRLSEISFEHLRFQLEALFLERRLLSTQFVYTLDELLLMSGPLSPQPWFFRSVCLCTANLLSSKDEMLLLEQPLLMVKLPPRKVKSMESL